MLGAVPQLQRVGRPIRHALDATGLLPLTRDLFGVGEICSDVDAQVRLAPHCRPIADNELLEQTGSDLPADPDLERILRQRRARGVAARAWYSEQRLPSVILGLGMPDDLGRCAADRQSVGRQDACVAVE